MKARISVMKQFANLGVRALCSLVLAFALVPASALSALAYEGEYFEIDGLTYLYTGATEGVQLVGADPEVIGAEDGTCTVPATVEFEGKTLVVMSIKTNSTVYNTAPNAETGGAFTGCTKLRDLRIECLSATSSSIYNSSMTSVFAGCTALETVHFLGNGGTAEVGNAALENLNVIVHPGSNVSGSGNQGTVGTYTTDGSSVVYYSVVFEQADGTQTEVFVKSDCTVSSLSALGDDDIYSDATWYGTSSALCLAPNSEVPALGEGNAWAVTTLAGTQLTYSDSISACCVALETDARDLSLGSMVLDTSSFTYDAAAGKDPGVNVLDAAGNVVSAQNYSVSYYRGTGSEKVACALDEIVEVGTYTVVASGVGSYSGECSATFAIEYVESSWTRMMTSLTSTTNLRHYASSQARLNASCYTNASGDSISTDAVIVVNPDDYASCVVATSLAGLFNCGVITVSEECIRESNGKLTATNVTNYASVLSKHLAIVLGSSDYISEELYEAVVNTVGDGKCTSLNTDACTSTAQIAEVAYAMMLACAEGEYSLGAEFESYSNAAMVVSSCGSASVFTALAWANANNMAVFFATAEGRVSTATAQYLADFESVVLAGFDEDGAAAVAAVLPEGVTQEDWGVEASEYASAISYAQRAWASGTNSWERSLSVCGSDDYGVLACVSASCGFAGTAMLVCDTTEAGEAALTEFVSEHTYEISTGYLYGTYGEISAGLELALSKLRMVEDSNSLAYATCEATTAYAYTGSAVTPACSISLQDGTLLEEGTDYILYYYRTNTQTACYTTLTSTYVPEDTSLTSFQIVSGSTSKMVDEGTYTVVARGTLVEYTNAYAGRTDNLYTGTTGTCSGWLAFTITIGEADEVLDYTGNYAEVLDEADYEQVDESTDTSGDEEASDGSASEGNVDDENPPAASTDSDSEDEPEKSTLAAQKISVKAAAKTLKVKKLKKKAVTCKFKVTGAHTALVAKAANKKSKKALKVKVSGKTVKVTVARGTKKGTYKVKVYAKASSGYAKSKKVTITIKVK